MFGVILRPQPDHRPNLSKHALYIQLRPFAHCTAKQIEGRFDGKGVGDP